jgi:tRNA A37 threonylcarbamoyladenosine synthetase subunit TsaC/SUA5/YrdC
MSPVVSERYPTGTDEEREAAVEAAALAVQQGELIVLPTDTVYGVGADAFDPVAVRALLAAKGRGRNMPPPVLVSSATTLWPSGSPATPGPWSRSTGPAR